MISVLVVDDHQVLTDGILEMLRSVDDIACNAAANSAEAALEQLEQAATDVVLLDIGLPGMDGLDACTAIRERHPNTRVIALSMHDGHHMISGMLERGASGYLLKNVGRAELIEAIRTVHGGGTHLSRQATEVLIDGLRQPQIHKEERNLIELTQREMDVLKLIVEELTTEEIGATLGISRSTVETHRRHLMEKLGARNSAGLVRIAMERGLLRA